MKRHISVLLAVLIMSLFSLNAYAVDIDKVDSGKTVITVGDWVYERIENDTYWELDEYVGSGGDVVVPRFLNNSLIVSFGDHCFMNNTSVKSVEMSPPLWTIGEYAFIDCTSLEKVRLDYALKTIKTGAFSGTSSLKDINLEDSVITKIYPYTFLNSGIEDVVLPETCTEIGNYGFGQCSQLKSITIPKSVTTIADTAFKGCESLVIYCYRDSFALQYAQNNGINYKIIDALLGDADLNGVININDATMAQMHDVKLIELSDLEKKAADVSRDGDVTVRDATLIQMYLANIITEF